MDRLKTDYCESICQECFPAVPPLIVAAPGQGCLGGLAVSHLIPLINPFESDSDGSDTDGEFDESLEEEMNEYTDMEPEEFRSEE